MVATVVRVTMGLGGVHQYDERHCWSHHVCSLKVFPYDGIFHCLECIRSSFGVSHGCRIIVTCPGDRGLRLQYILELFFEVFDNAPCVIRSFPIAREEVLHHNPRLQFTFENIAFVEEEDKGRFGQQFRGTDGAPEEAGVFETVDLGVFLEAFVETRYRREENDGVDVVKKGKPRLSHRPCSAYVVDDPFLSEITQTAGKQRWPFTLLELDVVLLHAECSEAGTNDVVI